MFALLIPPRPLLTPAQMTTISPTQSAYTFPASPSVSHISIFMLPDTALPLGTLAAIYIQLPGSGEFTLLGALGPEKQSATYRVKGLGGGGPGTTGQQQQSWGDGRIVGEVGGVAEVDMETEETPSAAATGIIGTGTGIGGGDANANAALVGDVTVGISIEPVDTLQPQLAALAARQQSQGAVNGRNGAGGVGGQGNAMALYGGQQQQQQPSTKVLAQRIIKNAFNFLASFEGGDGKVSLKSFEDWWKKFERRVEMDPGFLEKEDGAG